MQYCHSFRTAVCVLFFLGACLSLPLAAQAQTLDPKADVCTCRSSFLTLKSLVKETYPEANTDSVEGGLFLAMRDSGADLAMWKQCPEADSLAGLRHCPKEALPEEEMMILLNVAHGLITPNFQNALVQCLAGFQQRIYAELGKMPNGYYPKLVDGVLIPLGKQFVLLTHLFGTQRLDGKGFLGLYDDALQVAQVTLESPDEVQRERIMLQRMNICQLYGLEPEAVMQVGLAMRPENLQQQPAPQSQPQP